MAHSFVSQPLQRVVFALCEDANTPRSLAVAMLLEAGEYDQLFSLRIDPTSFYGRNFHDLLGFGKRAFCPLLKTYDHDRYLRTVAELYFLDAQCTEILRKIELDIPSVDRRGAAMKTFFTAEHECKKTNDRFAPFVNNGPFEAHDLRFFPLLDEMKRFVKRVLGPLPLTLDGKFGPGSTFGDRGQLVTVPDKMTSRPTVTSLATLLEPIWSRTAWCRYQVCDSTLIANPDIVRGNRFTTVPKDANKDRGICIEPSINVFYQLSVGRHIRGRLKRAGIDLTNGQEHHQLMACTASRTGDYATIDLSNASDTVSYNLVKLILPEDWFDLLDTLRASHTQVNGKWHRLEKFSSMGNGFTFELETLVFLSLCAAVSLCSNRSHLIGEDILVYGDDIIVPTDICNDVISGLKWLGFTPNSRKTFLSGPFRESCGGDFFHGVAVRPHYVKEDPFEPQHWISLANGLRRVGNSNPRVNCRFDSLRRGWFRALDLLPSHIRRLRGPSTLGDLVVHDEKFSRRWRSNGVGYIRVYRPVNRPLPWHYWKPNIIMASALYGLSGEGPLPRSSAASGYKVGWVSCS